MEMKTAILLCKKFNIRCYVSTTIREDGTIDERFGFWGANREKMRRILVSLGIHKTLKSFVGGDEDWKFDNVQFNQVRKCKIVGYEEEVVPEHIRKTPIYDCTAK